MLQTCQNEVMQRCVAAEVVLVLGPLGLAQQVAQRLL